jgi:phenylacetate-CoA ligase
MRKPSGRSDDMLIVRGVNVFPSQIEEVLLSLEGNTITPNYLIKIDRVNNNDTFDLDVEMSENLFADDLKSIAVIEKQITEKLRSMLGLGVKVHLVNPKSIARSEGKAKRILDLRRI